MKKKSKARVRQKFGIVPLKESDFVFNDYGCVEMSDCRAARLISSEAGKAAEPPKGYARILVDGYLCGPINNFDGVGQEFRLKVIDVKFLSLAKGDLK